MSKVTSKLQVTLPKRIAEMHGIHPGDEIVFESAGDVIRIIPQDVIRQEALNPEERLRLFDEATRRQQERESTMDLSQSPSGGRGWRREDLYERGSSK